MLKVKNNNSLIESKIMWAIEVFCFLDVFTISKGYTDGMIYGSN